MAVKLFLRNVYFSLYHKLSKLTFSEKNKYFFRKVHSDVDVYDYSKNLRHTKQYFVTRASEFFRANFQQGFLVFEQSFNIQTATKLFCRRL